jgi:hypothetical protein
MHFLLGFHLPHNAIISGFNDNSWLVWTFMKISTYDTMVNSS